MPMVALAAKTTYIVNDGRFNAVKLREVKPSVSTSRHMTHPVTLNEMGVRAALKSLKLSKSFLVKRKVHTQQIFNDAAIDYLAPAIITAFEQANSLEEINFSYLSKNPRFIVRNDYVHIVKCWISDNELHMEFRKLFAKISGDTDRRGTERGAMNRARGLRVQLELSPGQSLGASNREVVFKLDHPYEGYAMRGSVQPVPPSTDILPEFTPGTDDAKVKPHTQVIASSQADTSDMASTKNIEMRLLQLKSLHDKKLISDKEYAKKRQEILNAL